MRQSRIQGATKGFPALGAVPDAAEIKRFGLGLRWESAFLSPEGIEVPQLSASAGSVPVHMVTTSSHSLVSSNLLFVSIAFAWFSPIFFLWFSLFVVLFLIRETEILARPSPCAYKAEK